MEPPCPLNASHQLDLFDCAETSLNVYLHKHALQSQQSFGTVTYVCAEGSRVLGYYTLLFGSISPEQAPSRLSKGPGQYPAIPVLILARLAVDKTKHGHGLGKALLKDVLIRAVSGAELAGLRALVVHAKNASAKTFYENFDFEAFPNNPLHLYKLLSEIKKELRK